MLSYALAVAALVGAVTQQGDSAGQVMRHAVAAVEGDSVAKVHARWTRRVARDSTDRVARLGVAVLAQLTYQDTLTERLYRSLLPAPEVPGDAAAGYAAVYLARQLALRNQYLRADSVAARALAIGRALADSALIGEALVGFAGVRHRTRGGPAALSLLDSADAILPAGALRVRALSHCVRAQIYSFAGDRRSLAAAAAGVDLATQAGDFRVRAACRNVGASELARNGLLDSATTAYYSLVADYRRAKDRGGLAVALQWRSHLYRTVGWLAKAVRDAEESIVEAEASGVRTPIPWAQSTLARSAMALGDLARAAPHAAAATRLFLASGDRYGAITARGLEGDVAAATGDFVTARAVYTEALTRAQELGWAESVITLHLALMRLSLSEGDLAAAERSLAAGAVEARRANMPGFLKSNTYFAGVIALRAGRLTQAERLFRAGAAAAIAAQPQWHYLYAARLAEALVWQGRYDEAARELSGASEALDNWRRSLRDRDLRLYALQISEDPADPDLGVATVVNQLARHRFAENLAFGLAERVRARDLADRLTRAAATDSGTDRAIRSPEPVSMRDLMQAIPDDSTAVLRFVTGRGGEPTTLFVVTWRDFAYHTLLPEDSLAPAITRFTALLESGEDARDVGRHLADALVDRALGDLPPAVRRLVVVPDGVLHRLPFDALVMSDGRFVVERFAVSYTPSATIAAAYWNQRVAPAPEHTLVLADPRFANEGAAAPDLDGFRSAVTGRTGLARLPGSTREARTVARYAPAATVRRRADASEAWLKRAPLHSFGILHFATHALVDEASMTNTALALTPGGGEDGFVSPGELLGLRLAADLVVLSACRTAGGVVVRGEGVQGLAAPMLAAGARAVAVTWWPIGDAGTLPLVQDLYGGLADRLAISDALRAAKLKAIARGAPVREWAAFTIVGDPHVRPTVRHPRPRVPPLLFAGAALLVVLVVYGVVARRKRRTSERG